jgi:hypothetical protein
MRTKQQSGPDVCGDSRRLVVSPLKVFDGSAMSFFLGLIIDPRESPYT